MDRVRKSQRTQANVMSGSLMNSVRTRARLVVCRAKELTQMIAEETTDRLDSEWHDEALFTMLFGADYMDNQMLIANATRRLVAAHPVLVRVDLPCRVFGDTHGQLRDLLLLFHAFGAPSHQSKPDSLGVDVMHENAL